MRYHAHLILLGEQLLLALVDFAIEFVSLVEVIGLVDGTLLLRARPHTGQIVLFVMLEAE